MLALKRKSKTVTFRLSPEEHDAVSAHCLETHGGSISAFTRAAVLEKIHNAGGRPINISGDLATLAKILSELDSALCDASSRIRRLLGDGEHHSRTAESD